MRRPNGTFANLTKNGRIRDADRCGRDLVVSREIEPEKTVIERIDTAGRHIEQLSDGPADWSPACTDDGKVWYYRPHLPHAGVKRCDRDGCREIYPGFAIGLVGVARQPAPGVRHHGARADRRSGGCPPRAASCTRSRRRRRHVRVGWASASTIWVSRRRGRKIVWTEVDADSGRETGRTTPGSHDCNDLRPDPLSPVNPDLRVIYDQTSQVRLLPSEHLAAP